MSDLALLIKDSNGNYYSESGFTAKNRTRLHISNFLYFFWSQDNKKFIKNFAGKIRLGIERESEENTLNVNYLFHNPISDLDSIQNTYKANPKFRNDLRCVTDWNYIVAYMHMAEQVQEFIGRLNEFEYVAYSKQHKIANQDFRHGVFVRSRHRYPKLNESRECLFFVNQCDAVEYRLLYDDIRLFETRYIRDCKKINDTFMNESRINFNKLYSA